MRQDLHANAPPPAVREADPARGCRRLQGRVALLSAAARGIGFASAVRLAAEGAEATPATPQVFAALIASEVKRWDQVIKTAKITVD